MAKGLRMLVKSLQGLSLLGADRQATGGDEANSCAAHGCRDDVCGLWRIQMAWATLTNAVFLGEAAIFSAFVAGNNQ